MMKRNKETLEKFKAFTVPEQSGWFEEAGLRVENAGWLSMSRKIGLKVLRSLRAQGLTQKQLAEKMGITPQQVSKWVRGRENFTLETIDKLQNALGTTLLQIPESSKSMIAQITWSEVDAEYKWIDWQRGHAALFAGPEEQELFA